MSLDITAVILTFNESLHLRRCIKSLQGFVDNIIVVDSFSSDDTEVIANELGAVFLQNSWVNHSHQFNWALKNAGITSSWVFRVDADEYVEDDLKAEIISIFPCIDDSVSGFTVRRKYFFMGKWIRHGAMYPIEILRLFRLRDGYVEQRWMDEHVVLSQGLCRRLSGNIVDDNLNSVGWWIDKHNKYATLEMIEALNTKYSFMPIDKLKVEQLEGNAKFKRWIKLNLYSKLPYFFRPLLYFIYRYFFKLGFLDGTVGLAYHFMQGLWYRSLVDLKLLEAELLINNERDPILIRSILSTKTGLKL